jgi:uncharacterized protein
LPNRDRHPAGAYAIRRLDAETFRRVCMSFDVWIVGFGLARALAELDLAHGAYSYAPMTAAIMLDILLLAMFFSRRKLETRLANQADLSRETSTA